VRDVSDITGFPEMMDGRVKTLHPKIHGGLLGVRDNEEHQAAMRTHDIEAIDMVVINLYPFEQTIAREGVTLEEAIEHIDIGGPAMIRSAAKNFRDVVVVPDPRHYDFIVHEMKKNVGALSFELRQELAVEAFLSTAAYDGRIHDYLQEKDSAEYPVTIPPDELLNCDSLTLMKLSDLRYGENPHQKAALYRLEQPFRTDESVEPERPHGIAKAEVLSGKEMSFNNYVDADAAWQLVWDFDELTCAIIKHTNPAGAALGESGAEAYRRALATDPTSAFGGIVAFNRTVDEGAARAVIEIFTEVVVAPDYEPTALEVLKTKKNLRVLRAAVPKQAQNLEYKQISGGMLVQTRDTHRLKREELKFVTKREPAEDEINDLLFAWTVCKHTKSNAIVYARNGQTVGVGAGQMSRVDSVKLGAMRAQLPVQGSVVASDAFFPFRDGIDEAAKNGITAVIQPGGSMRDAEVIAACDEHNIAMVFTGIRHFKH
jgi:phosphoribosylaminoimidazolecarboxamide formyltransferase/IMP cyclohydrolase